MNITLIGMSGAGKTYWAKKLERKGFQRYSADDFIESKLSDELKKYGYSGIHDMAQWMGQPYDEQYATRSRRYLDLERKVMQEIIRLVKTSSNDSIIDTTGSVIYLDQSIVKELCALSTVIYFCTPPSLQRQMYLQYLADPKPVIWGDQFAKKTDESHEDALARCYPQLLQYRSKQYQQWADITLEFDQVRSKNFHVDQLLEIHQSI